MRIGLFADTYPPFINGVSTSVCMLKRALEKLGHTVYVVTVNPEAMKYKYEEDEHVVRLPGIPVKLYDYRISGAMSIRAFRQVKKWNLDVIHSHTEFGVGNFARICANQLNIPLVHTYHTMYEDYVHYITHGYFNNSSKEIVKYLSLFYCDKTVTELIVPTKKTYDLFKNKYKVDRNVHIIPTGIEIDRFYKENVKQKDIDDLRKSLDLKKRDFIIGYVGRIAEEKSIDTILNVVSKVYKKNNNIKLVIVCDGPDVDSLKKLSKKLKIDNITIFTGKVPWEEVPIYYNLFDLFVTASTTETQGLTVIEAMAASLPPICIEDESFLNVVVDGLNGKIFKTEDECASIVLELSNNKKELERLANGARRSADKYSSKYYAEAVLNVYKYALENKKERFGWISKLYKKVVDKK